MPKIRVFAGTYVLHSCVASFGCALIGSRILDLSYHPNISKTSMMTAAALLSISRCRDSVSTGHYVESCTSISTPEARCRKRLGG